MFLSINNQFVVRESTMRHLIHLSLTNYLISIFVNDRKKKMKLYSSDNTTTISVSTSITTPEVETDNAIIDMEREREMVEQYYKERNVLLTKAMFG